MKINNKIVLALISTLLISGCSENTSKDRLVNKQIFTVSDSGGVGSMGKVSLFFKANEQVPYISLKDGAKYITLFRQVKISPESKITTSIDNGVITYKTEEEATAVIDYNKQTISYSDYEAFNNYNSSRNKALSIFEPKETYPLKLASSTYTSGNAFTIDLKQYSRIDIYKYEEDYYLPLTTYSDIFLNPFTGVSLVYNNQNLFMLSDATPLTDEEDDEKLTELGKKYYNNKKMKTVSKSFAEFYYQSIALNFDYLYGLKDLRNYSSFDSYASSKGYKEDLLSGDVHKMDNAFFYLITTFKDAHSAATGDSPFYKFGEQDRDPSKYDQDLYNWVKGCKNLNKKRATTGASMGFSVDEENKIAYIAFNNFSNINIAQLKQDSWSEKDVLTNSATLFEAAYNQIISDKYKNKIEYVVVDLATNDGGSSDGLLFQLGILIGDFKNEMISPLTKAHNSSTYKVDINLDGKFNSDDKSLYELGYKICFIDSKYSFSCGNALPVLAKANKPGVIMLGETSGGGTCIVRTAFTALGSKYSLSGVQSLAKEKDGKYVNIEDGVPADITLTEDEMINRQVIASKLKAHN